MSDAEKDVVEECIEKSKLFVDLKPEITDVVNDNFFELLEDGEELNNE